MEYRDKVKMEIESYFVEFNRDTNKKKLFTLRDELSYLVDAVSFNEGRIEENGKKKYQWWCWYHGEKYSQNDLNKDKMKIRTYSTQKMPQRITYLV